MSPPKPFSVTIIGAGIAGLTAALHLRSSGFQVTVFEQSRLAAEIGAAFHITPNACAILSSLDIDVYEGGAVDYRAISFFDAQTGAVLARVPKAPEFEQLPKGEDWVLAHRYHLHKQLKDAAIARGPDLITSKHVQSVDAEHLVLHFADGSTHRAQCLLGADGVHSKVREALHPQIRPEATPYAAFRFMLDRSEVETRLRTLRKELLKPGEVYLWAKTDTTFIIYPTTNNTQLNFVCLLPTKLLDESPNHDSQYSQKANKEQLLSVYKDFEPQVQELIQLAHPETLRYWPLMDMSDLPSYVNDNNNIASLGDAAHPFLPFVFQGAGLAIKDGAAIGVMLENIESMDEIGERFQLDERLRHERCAREQQFSRDIFRNYSRDDD